MPDVLIPAAPAAAPAVPATPVAPATPARAADASIKDAGEKFRNAESWEALGAPAPVVDAPAAPATTAAAETPAPDAPEFVQNEHGQWHRPDGTFANVEEIAAITAQLEADAAATATVATPTVDAPKPVVLRRRDGTTREVQVDDPELAEEIRTNYNDGMRKKDYVEKVGAAEAKLAALTQAHTALTKNPESFVLNTLTPEQQINVATALLAQHFDALVPIVLGFDKDPTQRITNVAETQKKIREQEKDLDNYAAAQQQAALVRGAVELLIPETLPPEQAEQFWADASSDLQRAIARGDKVDPTTVAALLAPRMKLYGFDAPAGSVPAKPSAPRITAVAPAPSPVAVPANDAAIAAAKATQKRIKLTQTSRANAAAVPPVGAGAAPVRLPPVPAGASIEDAAKAMKKHRSWAS